MKQHAEAWTADRIRHEYARLAEAADVIGYLIRAGGLGTIELRVLIACVLRAGPPPCRFAAKPTELAAATVKV